MPCQQQYTPDLVKRIPESSEKVKKNKPKVTEREAQTIYGLDKFVTSSDEPTGHFPGPPPNAYR